MAIAVWVIWVIVRWLDGNKRIPDSRWALVGVVIGAATRVHAVVAAATAIVVVALLLGRRNRALFLIGGAAFSWPCPTYLSYFP